MLTVFAIPKPFSNHIDTIQRTAIGSWTRLHPQVEVILIGQDAGTDRVAKDLNCIHLPDVACSEYGTPMLHSAFEMACRAASHDTLCYVNADIILFDDLPAAIERIPFDRYLMVAQRWDLDPMEAPVTPSQNSLPISRETARTKARLHSPEAIDLFVFPRGSVGPLPPFAVGRPGWDNWMIQDALRRRVPVIDATESVTILHQRHDYGHVPHRRGKYYDGPEADANRSLLDNGNVHFTISDADLVLSNDTIHHKRLSWSRFRRWLETFPVLHPHRAWAIRPIRFIASKVRRQNRT